MKATRILKLFQARNVAVRLVTFEEAEVRDLIFEVAGELGLVPWVWSATGGVMTGPLAEAQPIPQTTNPGAALFTMRTQRTRPTMLVTLDLADHLAGEPVILRALRELIEDLRREETSSVYADGVASRLAMIDHREDVPGVIAAASVRYDVSLPDDEEIAGIVKRAVRSANRRRPVASSVTRSEFGSIVENLRGLTRRQVLQAATEIVVDDDALTAEDIGRVLEVKRRLLASGGVLEYVEAPVSLDEIGGLQRLKDWLHRRSPSFGPEAARAGDPAAFDLDTLVRAADGYSGAEIKQAIISALHEAAADGAPLDTARVQNALATSPPLSVTMAERIADLRRWARGRCVPAD